MDQAAIAPHHRIERVLRASGFPYRVYAHHECAIPIAKPSDFATALGVAIERITKTILLTEQSGSGRSVLVCCPSPSRVDMPQIAALVGYRRLQMASEQHLAELLDYPRHGVSPLGAPEECPVILDAALLAFPSIWIGAGSAGLEIELAPGHVQTIASARIFP